VSHEQYRLEDNDSLKDARQNISLAAKQQSALGRNSLDIDKSQSTAVCGEP